MPRRNWTREELILALSVYFQLPFGRLVRTNAEVIELGRLLGRGANSAALRLVNFAACDPYIIATGRHGMKGGEKVCQPIWDEFVNDKERLYQEAAHIRAQLQNRSVEELYDIDTNDYIGEEREAIVRQRVNQASFRIMILNNYNSTCAITGINDQRLLIASHIIPWADRHDTRLNPENGICLSALYDCAFDKGLIAVDPDDYSIILSPSLRDTLTHSAFMQHFDIINHRKLSMPDEHRPNPAFLQYHIQHIYIS